MIAPINSQEEIEKMAKKYPDKIRYYAYPYEIRGFNLSREEFEEIKNWPEGHPQLFSTYNNFSLSKVTSDYALKIDADHFFFTNKLKEWCDFVRNCEPAPITVKVIGGMIFKYYISLYRFLSLKTGCVLPMLPSFLLKIAYPAYLSYAKYAFSHDISCLSLSGVNVLETNETLISMGHPSDLLLMLPPFNGVGDALIFKMSDKVYYKKIIMDEYNNDKSNRFVIAEDFVHPYKSMTYIGFFWKHFRTMRPGVKEIALKAYSKDNEAFLSINTFKRLSYKQILKHSPKSIFFPFYRILFGFIYKANKEELFNSLETESYGALKK